MKDFLKGVIALVSVLVLLIGYCTVVYALKYGDTDINDIPVEANSDII